MATRKNPDTSIDAMKRMTVPVLSEHYSLIVSALKVLGMATYEEISKHLTWEDKNRASRRLKEMEGMQLVYKPGLKKLTKSGRSAYVYCLTGIGQPKTDNEVKYSHNEKTASDHAIDLINSTRQLSLL